MDVSQVSMTSAMAVMVRQLEGMADLQTAVMKQTADSQQQIAGLIQSVGIGQNIDIRA